MYLLDRDQADTVSPLVLDGFDDDLDEKDNSAEQTDHGDDDAGAAP